MGRVATGWGVKGIKGTVVKEYKQYYENVCVGHSKILKLL